MKKTIKKGSFNIPITITDDGDEGEGDTDRDGDDQYFMRRTRSMLQFSHAAALKTPYCCCLYELLSLLLLLLLLLSFIRLRCLYTSLTRKTYTYTGANAQLRRGGALEKKNVILKSHAIAMLNSAADCPPRYPFRFTTRNTLSRAHERSLGWTPEKTTTNRLALLSARSHSLSLGSHTLTRASAHWAAVKSHCKPDALVSVRVRSIQIERDAQRESTIEGPACLSVHSVFYLIKYCSILYLLAILFFIVQFNFIKNRRDQNHISTRLRPFVNLCDRVSELHPIFFWITPCERAARERERER